MLDERQRRCQAKVRVERAYLALVVVAVLLPLLGLELLSGIFSLVDASDLVGLALLLQEILVHLFPETQWLIDSALDNLKPARVCACGSIPLQPETRKARNGFGLRGEDLISPSVRGGGEGGASAYRWDPSLQLLVKLPLVAVGLLQDELVVDLGPGDALVRIEILGVHGKLGARVVHCR